MHENRKDNSARETCDLRLASPTACAETARLLAGRRAPSRAAAVSLVLLFSGGLAGCGGSGGDSSSPPPPPPPPPNDPPTAAAGSDQTVPGGANVVLDGSGSQDTDGILTGYAWMQVSGPPVILSGADTAAAAFVAPPAQVAVQDLVISLTVSDDDGAEAEDTVVVSIAATQPPEVEPIGDKGVLEGQLVSFLVSGFDPDGPPPVLSADFSGLPPGHGAQFVDLGTGQGRFTWETGLDDSLGSPYPVTFLATDADAPDVTGQQAAVIHVSALQGGATLLSDDFSDGSTSGWSFVNDSGIPAQWQETGGRLSQLNDTEEHEASYALGSYAVLTASSSLADYLAALEVYPQSGEGLDVGLVFRYQDPGNYYRFSLNSNQGYARLEKKTNGVFSTLVANSAGYSPADPETAIAVLVQGERMAVFIDGEPLFAAVDGDHGSGGVAVYAQDTASFDNLAVSDPPLQTLTAIATPVDGSVVPGGPVDLVTSAVVFGSPGGPEVDLAFEIDGAACEASAEPQADVFSSVCRGVQPGNHQVSASFQDNGAELARDTNGLVGVGSDSAGAHRYDALGDSITEGVGDNYARDNLNLSNQRTLAMRSWTGLLTDRLSNWAGVPSLVSNEGISGDRTDETLSRLDSILERNPVSDRALILLGTNDSNPFPGVAIGSGCSSSACDGTVKGNLLAIVDQLHAAGRQEIFLGLLPPAWGTSVSSTPYSDPLSGQRNLRVQEINAVIANEIAPSRAFVEIGPDLFECFLSDSVNRFSLFADNLHPNGLGHAQLAGLWFGAITDGPPAQSEPCTLPLYAVENLQPQAYKQNLLEAGDTYFVDEAFTLASVPPELADGVWIMTADADASDASLNFLSMDIGQVPVTVYLAYDSQGTPPASTSHTFLPVSLSSALRSSGGTVEEYSLVRASDVTGTVSIGGNRSGGAPLSRAMYLLIVVP